MTATRVAVIGAGTMGHGIAYVAALAGCEVRLTDSGPNALGRAIVQITSLLEGGFKRGKLTESDGAAVVKRVHAEPDIRGAVAGGEGVMQAGAGVLASSRGQ